LVEIYTINHQYD